MPTNGRVSRPRAVLSRNGSAMPHQRPDTGLVHPHRRTAQAEPKGARMAQLEGKVALGSGGDSGIGPATAEQFVKEGACDLIKRRRAREYRGTEELGPA